MKQLDLKSFGIGILLTSSFMFGVAATNVIGEMIWDEEQKWLAKRIKLDSNPSASLIDDQREQVVGWEFVGIEGQYLIYRRPCLLYTSPSPRD